MLKSRSELRQTEPMIRIIRPQQLSQLLKEELLERVRRNSRYSLRAFAKHLELEPSFLSKLIRGERTPGTKTLQKIEMSLGLSSKFEAENFQSIEADQFQLIADWYHYAILEALRIPGFSGLQADIGMAFGLNPIEVTEACSRLHRLHLIERGILPKQWKARPQVRLTTLATPSTNAALRKLQRGILEKAILALDETSVDARDQTSMTMALDPKILPLAKEKIKKMRRELCRWLEAQGKPEQVYHLSISLYPVTKIAKSNRSSKGAKK